MRTIWKYEIEVTDHISLELPVGAEFLTFALQHGRPCAWFRVDADARKETHRFRLAGTGDQIGDGRYLGTIQMAGGNSVFHLFELRK